MKAAELVEQVKGLDGRIAVWSHLLEIAEASLHQEGRDLPAQVRDVPKESITEVTQELEAQIAELKTARDDLLDMDVS